MSEEDIVNILPEAPPNPPAFARPGFAPEGVRSEDCGITDEQDGMSLRDFFAAFALAGLCAQQGRGLIHDANAETAYRQADAMLRRRVKE